MSIQAVHLANLIDYASYKNIEENFLRSFLNDSDLDFCNPDCFITEEEFLTVFEQILLLTKNPYLGLHFGNFLNVKALGFIIQISLNANTLEQAVYILQNYLQSSFPFVRLEVNGADVVSLQLKSEVVGEMKTPLLQMVFVFMYREMRLMLADNEEISLEVPANDLVEFEKFLPNTVSSSKNEYAICFDRKIWATPINAKKTKEIEVLVPQFLHMLEASKQNHSIFTSQVKRMILSMCTPELPTFDQVWIQFPYSSRTFQRKLADKGTTFRKITNAIKMELTAYLSLSQKFKTQEIAHLLGYAQSSSYLHAVKKWQEIGAN